MRENRLSGSEGGAGHIPVPTPIISDLIPVVGSTSCRAAWNRFMLTRRHSAAVAHEVRPYISDLISVVGSTSGRAAWNRLMLTRRHSAAVARKVRP